MKPKLLLLEDFDNLEAKEKLSHHVEFVRNSWHEFCGYDGIYVKLKDFEYCEDMHGDFKFIATPCTGTDHINIPEGVKLIHLDQEFKDTVGRLVTSTAEHTLSLMLQLAKKKGIQLSGKRLGIIGWGRIGSKVAQYCFNMDMKVYGYDINQHGMDNQEQLENVLKESDVISIHVPFNEETKGMIDIKEIEMMKDGAMIINTSRQEVVDVQAITYGIEYKSIYYADDFGCEDNFYFTDNCYHETKVIQTPHIGGKTHESRMITDMYVADKIIQYLGANK